MTPKITTRYEGARVPLPGQVISVMLSLTATTVLTLFLTQRVLVIKAWSRLPPVVWLVFAIYIDSYIFVIATAILQHSLGVNSGYGICEAAIILCLVCYVTTKFIYLFLAEKAYIIRGATKPRLKSSLYLVNSLGMLTIYIAVVILNFIFRITNMKNGECIIGMRTVAMIPLISFDTVINVYLTIMFLIPLKKLYSYTNMARTQANIRLRMVAFRTFCGAVCTLVSSIVNLSVLMGLNGEPGWVCLMCCNCDILFSAIVIQWVTSRDNAGTVSSTSSGEGGRSRDLGPGINRISTPSELHETPSSTLADISLVPTRRRSRGDDYDDPHENENPGKNTAKAFNRPSTAVMVTTTIERETRPHSYNFAGLRIESSKSCGCGCLISLKSGVVDERSLSPHTKITAGGSHFVEDFDQKTEPCYCQTSCSREIPTIT
ncbi:hypothetical protein V8C37DRAFT_408861 [Trichoderma ceciliae]